MPRLHVNVDHVATVRQARRETFPDPVAWAQAALDAGADGITCHLRKDRRHIQDADVERLRGKLKTFLNLELSLDAEMLAIGCESRADAFCLVPENRQEVTTEGGLDVVAERSRLLEAVPRLTDAGGLVSLFVDADREQIECAAEVGAKYIELHTGAYANASGDERARELERLQAASELAHSLKIGVNAGHGLDYTNVQPIAQLPHVEELNIGFAIVAEALSSGVANAIQSMKTLL